MKTVIGFWTVSIAFVAGLIFWRNAKRYPLRSFTFQMTKTLTEVGILFLSAWRLPALLCAWISFWLTRPIKDPRVKLTVGIIIGALIGLSSMYVMEIVMVFAALAIDDITGDRDGFIGDWKKAKWADLQRNNFHQKVA